MADHIGEQFGNYQLTQLLGTGGFAQVYLGEHIHLGTEVAIKVLIGNAVDQTAQEMFEQEARALAGLVHPHIVRLHDFGTKPLPYLVMEFIKQGSVRNLYARGAIVPLAEVVSYVGQVASALQCAHDKRLIHRDVKPENLLIRAKDQIVLSDFGIVVAAHSGSSLRTVEVIGTVAYMSPEHVNGKPTPATDQYALAVVVYEWLSGTLPFVGASFMNVATQVLFATPDPLTQRAPGITPAINAVVMRAMAKDPKDRFASVTEFAEELEQAYRQSLQDMAKPNVHPGSGNTKGNMTTAIAIPGLPTQVLSFVPDHSAQTSAQVFVALTETEEEQAVHPSARPKHKLFSDLTRTARFLWSLSLEAFIAGSVSFVVLSIVMVYVVPLEAVAVPNTSSGPVFIVGIIVGWLAYLTYYALARPRVDSKGGLKRFFQQCKLRIVGTLVGLVLGSLVLVTLWTFVAYGWGGCIATSLVFLLIAVLVVGFASQNSSR